MYKLRRQFRRFAIWFVAFLVSSAAAQIRQQAGPALPQQDAFASVHARLTDAADRALATAISERPWMQTETAAPETNGTVATAADLVVRLHAGIERVRQLQPTIEPILRDEGVPTELSAIVLLESGGIPTALSPKGARGVWQFMPGTARRYGLVVSPERDDRLDVAKSTRAAARYLRDLYQQFGNWKLAFAAYNAGERAVGRALGQSGQRDFLAIQRVLPLETRNYVPAVLQAMTRLIGNTDCVSEAASNSSQSAGRIIYASAEKREKREKGPF